MSTKPASYGVSPVERMMREVDRDLKRRLHLAQAAVDCGMWTKEVAEAVYRVNLGAEK